MRSGKKLFLALTMLFLIAVVLVVALPGETDQAQNSSNLKRIAPVSFSVEYDKDEEKYIFIDDDQPKQLQDCGAFFEGIPPYRSYDLTYEKSKRIVEVTPSDHILTHGKHAGTKVCALLPDHGKKITDTPEQCGTITFTLDTFHMAEAGCAPAAPPDPSPSTFMSLTSPATAIGTADEPKPLHVLIRGPAIPDVGPNSPVKAVLNAHYDTDDRVRNQVPSTLDAQYDVLSWNFRKGSPDVQTGKGAGREWKAGWGVRYEDYGDGSKNEKAFRIYYDSEATERSYAWLGAYIDQADSFCGKRRLLRPNLCPEQWRRLALRSNPFDSTDSTASRHLAWVSHKLEDDGALDKEARFSDSGDGLTFNIIFNGEMVGFPNPSSNSPDNGLLTMTTASEAGDSLLLTFAFARLSIDGIDDAPIILVGVDTSIRADPGTQKYTYDVKKFDASSQPFHNLTIEDGLYPVTWTLREYTKSGDDVPFAQYAAPCVTGGVFSQFTDQGHLGGPFWHWTMEKNAMASAVPPEDASSTLKEKQVILDQSNEHYATASNTLQTCTQTPQAFGSWNTRYGSDFGDLKQCQGLPTPGGRTCKSTRVYPKEVCDNLYAQNDAKTGYTQCYSTLGTNDCSEGDPCAPSVTVTPSSAQIAPCSCPEGGMCLIWLNYAAYYALVPQTAA